MLSPAFIDFSIPTYRIGTEAEGIYEGDHFREPSHPVAKEQPDEACQRDGHDVA